MQKYLLLRSVAIFTILTFLMMLTLGQIAFSQETQSVEELREISNCAITNSLFIENNVRVKQGGTIDVDENGWKSCLPFVQLCHDPIAVPNQSFFKGYFDDKFQSTCVSVTTKHLTEGKSDLIFQSMLNLANSSRSQRPVDKSRMTEIRQQILSVLVNGGAAEAQELMISILYNEAALLDGN